MIRILGARWPMAKVLVVPVRVQGEGAAQEIAQALDLVNACRMAEVIITGRGGRFHGGPVGLQRGDRGPGHRPVGDPGDLRGGP